MRATGRARSALSPPMLLRRCPAHRRVRGGSLRARCARRHARCSSSTFVRRRGATASAHRKAWHRERPRRLRDAATAPRDRRRWRIVGPNARAPPSRFRLTTQQPPQSRPTMHDPREAPLLVRALSSRASPVRANLQSMRAARGERCSRFLRCARCRLRCARALLRSCRRASARRAAVGRSRAPPPPRGARARARARRAVAP